MKTTNAFSLIALTAILFLASVTSQAALYDRGNGMIYDSAQNITWLQDANYALTAGYETSYGKMTWAQTNIWVDNLVFGGYSDWRLPSAKLIGDESFSYDGSTDLGYNNTRSELGHLFFELGNNANFNTSGVYQSGFGVTNTSFTDAATNQSVSFLNMRNDGYWEAELSVVDPSEAWLFFAYSGSHYNNNKTYSNFAWAVRDGDVAVVPVPAAAWLFVTGLVGLMGAARRK